MTTRRRKTKAKKKDRSASGRPLASKLMRLRTSSQCLHGFVPYPDGFSENMAFLENFIDEIADSEFHTGLLAAFKATLENHYDVWEDGTRLKWVSSFFLFQATEDILVGAIEEAHSDTSLACFFDQISDIARSAKSMRKLSFTKVKELKLTDEHTVVSFLRKRIACSCLDKRYERVKSITKMGLCMNPQCSRGTRVERSTMLFCTQCRRENYCSRACQREAWPKHKHVCARRVGRNKNAVKNDAFYFKLLDISAFAGTLFFIAFYIWAVSNAKFEPEPFCMKEERELNKCWGGSLLEQERIIVTHGVGINPYARGPNYSANVYNAATDREWDKLSKATQDALDCAWDGTKYFQEKYANLPSCDYTSISICGMLKYCINKADECKSEAVALFTCRDSNNDGGCRCSW
jgi:hypothetical protein